MAGIVKQGDNLWFTAADEPSEYDKFVEDWPISPPEETPAPSAKPPSGVEAPKPAVVIPNSNKFKTPANQLNKVLETTTPPEQGFHVDSTSAFQDWANKYPAFHGTYFKPQYQETLKSYLGDQNYAKLLHHAPTPYTDALTIHQQKAAPKSNKFNIPFNSLKKNLDASGDPSSAAEWMQSHPATVKTYMSTPTYHDAIKQHIGEKAYKTLLNGMTPEQQESFTGKKPEHKPESSDSDDIGDMKSWVHQKKNSVDLDKMMSDKHHYYTNTKDYKDWKSALSPEDIAEYLEDPGAAHESFDSFLSTYNYGDFDEDPEDLDDPFADGHEIQPDDISDLLPDDDDQETIKAIQDQLNTSPWESAQSADAQHDPRDLLDDLAKIWFGDPAAKSSWVGNEFKNKFFKDPKKTVEELATSGSPDAKGKAQKFLDKYYPPKSKAQDIKDSLIKHMAPAGLKEVSFDDIAPPGSGPSDKSSNYDQLISNFDDHVPTGSAHTGYWKHPELVAALKSPDFKQWYHDTGQTETGAWAKMLTQFLKDGGYPHPHEMEQSGSFSALSPLLQSNEGDDFVPQDAKPEDVGLPSADVDPESVMQDYVDLLHIGDGQYGPEWLSSQSKWKTDPKGVLEGLAEGFLPTGGKASDKAVQAATKILDKYWPDTDDLADIQQQADGMETTNIKSDQALLNVNSKLHQMFPQATWDDNQTPEQAVKTLNFLINNLDKDDYSKEEIESLVKMNLDLMDSIDGNGPPSSGGDAETSDVAEAIKSVFPHIGPSALETWTSKPLPQVKAELQDILGSDGVQPFVKEKYQQVYDKLFGQTGQHNDQAPTQGQLNALGMWSQDQGFATDGTMYKGWSSGLSSGQVDYLLDHPKAATDSFVDYVKAYPELDHWSPPPSSDQQSQAVSPSTQSYPGWDNLNQDQLAGELPVGFLATNSSGYVYPYQLEPGAKAYLASQGFHGLDQLNPSTATEVTKQWINMSPGQKQKFADMEKGSSPAEEDKSSFEFPGNDWVKNYVSQASPAEVADALTNTMATDNPYAIPAGAVTKWYNFSHFASPDAKLTSIPDQKKKINSAIEAAGYSGLSPYDGMLYFKKLLIDKIDSEKKGVYNGDSGYTAANLRNLQNVYNTYFGWMDQPEPTIGQVKEWMQGQEGQSSPASGVPGSDDFFDTLGMSDQQQHVPDPKPSLEWLHQHYPQTSDWSQDHLDDWYDKYASGENGPVPPAIKEWNKYQDSLGEHVWNPEQFQQDFVNLIDSHGKQSGSSLYGGPVTPAKAESKLQSMIQNTPEGADPSLSSDIKRLYNKYFSNGIPPVGNPYKFPDQVGQYDVVPKTPAKPMKSEPMDPEDFMHYMDNKPTTNADWNSMTQWWAATQVTPEAEQKLYSAWFPHKPTPSPEQVNGWFKAVFDQFSEPSDEDLLGQFTPAWAHADWAFGDNADKEWPIFKRWATTDPDLPVMDIGQKMHVWKNDLSDEDKASLAEDYGSSVDPNAVLKALKSAFPESNFTKWSKLTPGEIKNSIANLVKSGFVEAGDVYEHFYGEHLEPPVPQQEGAEGSGAGSPGFTMDASQLPDWASAMAKKGNQSALNDHFLTDKLLRSIGAEQLLSIPKDDLGYYQKVLLRKVKETLDQMSGAQKRMVESTPLEQLPWYKAGDGSPLEDNHAVAYEMPKALAKWVSENPDTSTLDTLADIFGKKPTAFSAYVPQSLVRYLKEMDNPQDKMKALKAYHDQFEHGRPTLAEYLKTFDPDTDWDKILQSSDYDQVLKTLRKAIKSADSADKYVGFVNALAKYFPKTLDSSYDVANSGEKFASSVLKSLSPGYGLSNYYLKELGRNWNNTHGLDGVDYDPSDFNEGEPSAYSNSPGVIKTAPYVGWTPPGDSSGGFKLDPGMFASHKIKKYKVPDKADLDSPNSALLKELTSNAHLDRDVTWSAPKFSSEFAQAMAPTIKTMGPQQKQSFDQFLSKASPAQAKSWVADLLDHNAGSLDAWQQRELENIYDKYFTGSGYSDKDKAILASPAFTRFFNSAPEEYQEVMALHPGMAIDDFTSVLNGTLNSSFDVPEKDGPPKVFAGQKYPYTTEADKHTVASGPHAGEEAYTVHMSPTSTFEYIPKLPLTEASDSYFNDRGESHWPGFSYNPMRNDSNRQKLVKHEEELPAPGQQQFMLPPGQSFGKPEKPITMHRGVALHIENDLMRLKSSPPQPPSEKSPEVWKMLEENNPAKYKKERELYDRARQKYGLDLYRRTLLQQINYLLKGSSFKDMPDLFNSAAEDSEGFVPVPSDWEHSPPHGAKGVLDFNKWITKNHVPDEQVYDLAMKWGMNNPEDYGVPGLSNGPWTEGLSKNLPASKSTQLSDLLAEYLTVTDFRSGEGYAPPGSFGDHWTANSGTNGTAAGFAGSRGDLQVLSTGQFPGMGENPDTAHVAVGFGSSIGNGENEITYSPGAPFDLTDMMIRGDGYGIPNYLRIPVRKQRRYA